MLQEQPQEQPLINSVQRPTKAPLTQAYERLIDQVNHVVNGRRVPSGSRALRALNGGCLVGLHLHESPQQATRRGLHLVIVVRRTRIAARSRVRRAIAVLTLRLAVMPPKRSLLLLHRPLLLHPRKRLQSIYPPRHNLHKHFRSSHYDLCITKRNFQQLNNCSERCWSCTGAYVSMVRDRAYACITSFFCIHLCYP